MISHNKLVRDKIPEIIASSGRKYKSHIADFEEYETMLKRKLLEEVNEFVETPCTEELADIYEVMQAIIKHFDFDISDVEAVQKTKKSERGGFDHKIILEHVE